jgi:hypothetical protein
MALRYRSSIFVAFGLLLFYFAVWRDEAPFQAGSHTIDVLKGVKNTAEHDLVEPRPPGNVGVVQTPSLAHGVSTSSAASDDASTSVVADYGSSINSAVPESSILPAHGENQIDTAAPEAPSASADDLTLQGQFDKESDALGL